MRKIAVASLMLLISSFVVIAQQDATTPEEKRVPVSEAAVALDAMGTPILEAKLLTSALTGAPDAPLTNVRFVVRNLGLKSFAYVSGVLTFYDSGSVRCGEEVFKAEELAANEQFETDAPGLRLRCTPATWRITASNMVPRLLPMVSGTASSETVRSSGKLVISIDGEQHPIQLDKPIKLNLGDRQRTIVVREIP
jgi:hypothetical protein